MIHIFSLKEKVYPIIRFSDTIIKLKYFDKVVKYKGDIKNESSNFRCWLLQNSRS